MIERLQVTPQELEALSKVSLLGSLTCRQDALFVLRQLRSAMKPAGLPATLRPESLQAPYDIGLYDSWIAELVRRESWLDQMNSIHREISIIATRFTVLLSFRQRSS